MSLLSIKMGFLKNQSFLQRQSRIFANVQDVDISGLKYVGVSHRSLPSPLPTPEAEFHMGFVSEISMGGFSSLTLPGLSLVFLKPWNVWNVS